jgi:hypothetical protein
MARTTATKEQTAEAETVTSYFRRVFLENRKLLKTRSNDEVMQRWQADHPGEKVTNKVKGALANAKGSLRQKLRKRKGGRPKAEQAQDAVVHLLPKPTNPPRHLEALEERIDDCLSMAKGMDRDSLGDVIVLLRRARNQVVWKLGQ